MRSRPVGCSPRPLRAARSRPCPRRPSGPRLGQRRDPRRGDGYCRALGRGKSTLLRLLNRLADPDPARRLPWPRRCASATRSSCGGEVSLVPQLPALLAGTVDGEPRLRSRAGRAASRRARAAWPRRARPGFAERDVAALGRRAAARDAGPRARPSPTSCCSTSRPRRSTRRARDAVEATLLELRRERGSRSCSSPTTPRRRGGWRVGRAARGRPRGRRGPARGG